MESDRHVHGKEVTVVSISSEPRTGDEVPGGGVGMRYGYGPSPTRPNLPIHLMGRRVSMLLNIPSVKAPNR